MVHVLVFDAEGFDILDLYMLLVTASSPLLTSLLVGGRP